MRYLPTLFLAFAACSQPAADDLFAGAESLPVDEAAPPTVLTLGVDGGVIGGSMIVSTTGANPGERVYLVRTTHGLGAGGCYPALGGQCLSILGPVTMHDIFSSNGTGVGLRVSTIPNIPALNGAEVCFQAGLVRGAGGAASVLSNPSCIQLGYDADNDTVIDALDVCAGGDDTLNADGDAAPDACDICPAGDDSLDGDGDGVPDACDVCAGYDDNIDSDADGTPDGCETTFADWLVGTPCNGTDFGGGCTPAETGYHFQGVFPFNGVDHACWWHTKNQAWNTTTVTDFYALGQAFGLDPNTGGSTWCFPEGLADPCTTGACSGSAGYYFDPSNIGAWGWCGGAPFASGGYVCMAVP